MQSVRILYCTDSTRCAVQIDQFDFKDTNQNSYLHQDEFQKTNIVLSLLYRDTAGVHYSSLSCWPLEMDEESDEEIPRGTDHKILGCQGYFHTRAYAHPHRHKKDDEMLGEAAQTRTNGQEGSTVYLVGLERNNLLGVASVWPNTKFRSLLSTTVPFEASD
ncbi:uncharacterized protein TNCV_1617381 [Trichonephila clavipes]|nr:uncharacterized protein TNCV_1617381 [Trichonephila clavipes]